MTIIFRNKKEYRVQPDNRNDDWLKKVRDEKDKALHADEKEHKNWRDDCWPRINPYVAGQKQN